MITLSWWRDRWIRRLWTTYTTFFSHQPTYVLIRREWFEPDCDTTCLWKLFFVCGAAWWGKKPQRDQHPLIFICVFLEKLEGEKLNVAEVTQSEIAQKQKLQTVLERINDSLKLSTRNIRWNVDCKRLHTSPVSLCDLPLFPSHWNTEFQDLDLIKFAALLRRWVLWPVVTLKTRCSTIFCWVMLVETRWDTTDPCGMNQRLQLQD